MKSTEPNSVAPIFLQRAPGLFLVLDTPKGCSCHFYTYTFSFVAHFMTNYSPLGRGVFASCNIPAKTVVDICPVLVLSVEENEKYVKNTHLVHYT